MSYYLRLNNRKKGTYLQIYDRYWDKDLKQARSKSVQAIGYLDDLKSDEMPDPIAYFRAYAESLNKERKATFAEETRARVFDSCVEKNVGAFLLHTLIEELDVKKTVDILASVKQFQFSVSDMIEQLIISRVIAPCSKSKTVSSVFPLIWNNVTISEDQIYDGLEFIGNFYNKYIELFNYQYEKYYKRDYSRVFFDCTNYYFEINLPYEDKQKGPSKENRHEPIIGQALLLDSDLVPLGMQMYPGNESEKPYIRKCVEEMKARYKVKAKTVQVADKGLNCAKNIYAATKEANDGYIFSKSIHGRNLSEKEKEWITLDNDGNKWTNYTDDKGILLYRLKSCIDEFEYTFRETDAVTGAEKSTTFTVKEKRIVSYNPMLAKKQQAEIKKMVDKAANCTTYKKLSKEEYGEVSKYINIISKDKNGKKVKPIMEIDEEKVNEDLRMAGYNLIVTSELKMSPKQIYETYHQLWKIEESFRITKSYLDARPVYVQKRETIYGHFLICYLCLFLLRVLEIKCFRNSVNSYDIIEFIRDFRVADKGDGTFINLSHNQKVNEKIKEVTALTNLDALILTKDEIEQLFNSTMLINS